MLARDGIAANELLLAFRLPSLDDLIVMGVANHVAHAAGIVHMDTGLFGKAERSDRVIGDAITLDVDEHPRLTGELDVAFV